MNKRTLCLALCAFALFGALAASPVRAEESKPAATDKSEGSSGPHNFDTWQTIKRLQAPSQEVPRLNG